MDFQISLECCGLLLFCIYWNLVQGTAPNDSFHNFNNLLASYNESVTKVKTNSSLQDLHPGERGYDAFQSSTSTDSGAFSLNTPTDSVKFLSNSQADSVALSSSTPIDSVALSSNMQKDSVEFLLNTPTDSVEFLAYSQADSVALSSSTPTDSVALSSNMQKDSVEFLLHTPTDSMIFSSTTPKDSGEFSSNTPTIFVDFALLDEATEVFTTEKDSRSDSEVDNGLKYTILSRTESSSLAVFSISAHVSHLTNVNDDDRVTTGSAKGSTLGNVTTPSTVVTPIARKEEIFSNFNSQSHPESSYSKLSTGAFRNNLMSENIEEEKKTTAPLSSSGRMNSLSLHSFSSKNIIPAASQIELSSGFKNTYSKLEASASKSSRKSKQPRLISTPTGDSFNVSDSNVPMPGANAQSISLLEDNVVNGTWAWIHKYSCLYRCNNDEDVMLKPNKTLEVGLPIYCYLCKCDRRACQAYDMCCPNVDEPYTPQITPALGFTENSSKFASGNMLKRLACHRVDRRDPLMVIRSCPRSHHVKVSDIELCENDTPVHQKTTELLTVVLDMNSNKAYRNTFCAKCNNASSTVSARLTVECQDSMDIYMARSLDELIDISLQKPLTCTLSQSLDTTLDALRCKSNNEYFELEGGISFVGSVATNPGKRPTGSLTSFLLNFDEDSYVSYEEPTSRIQFLQANCSVIEWSTPDGRCRPLECTAGKVLVNSTCISAFKEMSGLDYRLRLWLIPENTSKEIEKLYNLYAVLQNVIFKFRRRLQSQKCDFYIQSEIFDKSVNVKGGLAAPFLIKLDAKIQGPATIPRDGLESAILEHLINKPVSVDRLNMTFVQIVAWSRDFRVLTCGGLKRYRSVGHCKGSVEASENYDDAGYQETDKLLIDVNNLLSCPHVTFEKSEYQLNLMDSGLPLNFNLTIHLNVTDVTLSGIEDLNQLAIQADGNLSVCHEMLTRKLKEIQNGGDVFRGPKPVDAAMEEAKRILSLLCTGVSVFCLLLTVMTYLIHPVLRTTAGKNNMMLSISLILAQVSLLAAYYQPSNGPLCTALAISTHFLWLWMFTWSFICSFHMFRVFTAKTRSATCIVNDCKTFVRLCLVSLLLPVTVVLAVVVVSYVISEGQKIGYGFFNCGLDSVLLTGVSLACPLLAIVIANVIFLIITVTRIHKVRELKGVKESASKADQNWFFIYVKLSAMTGGFWLLAFLAEVSDSDYLRLITLPINGLQGVYICFSYICNRRVVDLYLRKYHLKAQTSTATADLKTQTSTATADLKTQTSKATADLKTQTSKATADLKKQTSTATADLKTQTSTTTADLKTQTSTATADLKTQASTATGDLKTKTSTATGDLKTQASTATGDLKTQTSTATGDLKTQTSKATADLKTQTRTATTDLKTQTSTATSDLKTQTSKATADLKIQTRTATADLKTQTRTATADLKTQTRTATADL